MRVEVRTETYACVIAELRNLSRQLLTGQAQSGARAAKKKKKKTRKPVAADDFLSFLQTQASMRSQDSLMNTIKSSMYVA